MNKSLTAAFQRLMQHKKFFIGAELSVGTKRVMLRTQSKMFESAACDCKDTLLSK